MPIYVYVCDDCLHQDEVYQMMRDEPLVHCPNCDRDTYHRVPCLPHINMKEFSTPIEMHSIACIYPEQIEEFKRDCPGVDCSDNPEDPLYGVPIARSRRDKLKALDSAGFVEKN